MTGEDDATTGEDDATTSELVAGTVEQVDDVAGTQSNFIATMPIGTLVDGELG